MRMLILEAEQASRTALQDALSTAGYDVEAVATLGPAKEILARGQTDLVLAELAVSTDHAIALVGELKRAAPGVLVLFAANGERAGQATEVLRHGAFDFVRKPIELPSLLLAIERAAELHALRRDRARLEAEVASQMAVLAARNVALERLKRARQEQVDFLVHDFRNPLTAIQGHLDYLLATPDLPLEDRQRALGDARAAAKRLGEMIRDLLDIGHSSDGRMAIHLQKLAARPLFEEIAERHAARARARGGRITLDVKGSAAITADPELLRRILSNLVENALHYGGKGVHITLSLGAVPTGQSIVVADDGPGIPEELRERIFERYAGDDNPGHYGLGLAFCKVATAAHGGTIQAAPNQPRGSRFEIVFPND